MQVMKQLQHDNIVKYLGTETTDGRLNIFLEWVSGGSIAQLISNYGALDEPVVRRYTRQILVGLDFLHDKVLWWCFACAQSPSWQTVGVSAVCRGVGLRAFESPLDVHASLPACLSPFSCRR